MRHVHVGAGRSIKNVVDVHTDLSIMMSRDKPYLSEAILCLAEMAKVFEKGKKKINLLMRIVMDTNVLVSALIKPFGNPAKILDMVLGGELQVLYDDRILLEFREVLLKPKFCFDESDVEDLLAFIEVEGVKVLPAPVNEPFIDEDDITFIEVAIAGMAEVLITGNKRHFKGIQTKKTKVMTPDEFLKFWSRRKKQTRSYNRGGYQAIHNKTLTEIKL